MRTAEGCQDANMQSSLPRVSPMWLFLAPQSHQNDALDMRIKGAL